MRLEHAADRRVTVLPILHGCPPLMVVGLVVMTLVVEDAILGVLVDKECAFELSRLGGEVVYKLQTNGQAAHSPFRFDVTAAGLRGLSLAADHPKL